MRLWSPVSFSERGTSGEKLVSAHPIFTHTLGGERKNGEGNLLTDINFCSNGRISLDSILSGWLES
jgi:hypothetical protein